MSSTRPHHYTALIEPHITEKSSLMAEHNTYAFKVNGTKRQISSAVSNTYGVGVVSVRTLNYKPELKRTQKGGYKTPRYKIAYVRVAEGQTIDYHGFLDSREGD